VEYNPKVTGDAPAAAGHLTGTPCQGPQTAQGWTSPGEAARIAQRLARRAARQPVTGDTPATDSAVTGIGRGAARDITGTPYYRTEATDAPAEGGFSIRSPQRAAHEQARAGGELPPPSERITGSFAVGAGKVSGNIEFTAKPRAPRGGDRAPAHSRVTGEGLSLGKLVTGDAWSDKGNVTGTESSFAQRNPTEAGAKAKAFAGSATFKDMAVREEAKQLVTGMAGYFNKSGAKVTLSGGAMS
jgi:hypothetical protein